MRYTKKPVTIEAVRFLGINSDGDPFFGGDVPEWLIEAIAGPQGHSGSIWVDAMPTKANPLGMAFLIVATLAGSRTASPCDWIIRGIKGEIYPCKPDIFEATYAPEAAPPAEHAGDALDYLAAAAPASYGEQQKRQADDIAPIFLKAQAAAAGSQMLDMQQECITLRVALNKAMVQFVEMCQAAIESPPPSRAPADPAFVIGEGFVNKSD